MLLLAPACGGPYRPRYGPGAAGSPAGGSDCRVRQSPGTDSQGQGSARTLMPACATAWTIRGKDAKVPAHGENAVRLNPDVRPLLRRPRAVARPTRTLCRRRGRPPPIAPDRTQDYRRDEPPGLALGDLPRPATPPRRAGRPVRDGCLPVDRLERAVVSGHACGRVAEAGHFDMAIARQQKALEDPAYQRQHGREWLRSDSGSTGRESRTGRGRGDSTTQRLAGQARRLCFSITQRLMRQGVMLKHNLRECAVCGACRVGQARASEPAHRQDSRKEAWGVGIAWLQLFPASPHPNPLPEGEGECSRGVSLRLRLPARSPARLPFISPANRLE